MHFDLYTLLSIAALFASFFFISDHEKQTIWMEFLFFIGFLTIFICWYKNLRKWYRAKMNKILRGNGDKKLISNSFIWMNAYSPKSISKVSASWLIKSNDKVIYFILFLCWKKKQLYIPSFTAWYTRRANQRTCQW